MAAHVLRRCVLQVMVKRFSLNREFFAANFGKRNCAGLAGGRDDAEHDEKEEVAAKKRVFSGIQPTGCLHLGNYFGAVTQWLKMQEDSEDMLISIVDLHSVTLPQKPEELRENIFQMAACLLACGIEPDRCVLFQQSRVLQHLGLAWVLNGFTTIARLNRLPQYKEKSSKLKEIPPGLSIYPVLQAADILLYKATHVPVGEDQLQHIQVAQDVARAFNNAHGPYFPRPRAIVGEDATSRVRSLRDPTKKMSKSDLDPRGRIELTDSDDAIAEKLKKALTDFTSAVTYDPEGRPAVSNLVNIERLLTGRSAEEVCRAAAGLTTAQYKVRLADVVVHAVRPIRNRIAELTGSRDHLDCVLRAGSEKAERMAEETWSHVRRLVGFS